MNFISDKRLIGASIVTALAAANLVSSPLKPMTPVQVFNKMAPGIVSIKTYTVERDVFARDKYVQTPLSIGTGFILNAKKQIIVTNGHVLHGAVNTKITFKDGKTVDASLIDTDHIRDVAFLKYDDDDSSTKSEPVGNKLEFCKSTPQIGTNVLAVGNPFGLENSLSAGIISGTGRNIEGGSMQDSIVNMIQTDASINPGNSGGPLIDVDHGCVVGMNTAMIAPGIGLAIPAQDIQDSFDVILNGKWRLDILGFELMPDAFVERLGLPGIPIVSIREGSLANQFGFTPSSRDEYGIPHLGDIILSINSTQIHSTKDLRTVINKSNKHFVVEVLNNGTKRTVVIEKPT